MIINVRKINNKYSDKNSEKKGRIMRGDVEDTGGGYRAFSRYIGTYVWGEPLIFASTYADKFELF